LTFEELKELLEESCTPFELMELLELDGDSHKAVNALSDEIEEQQLSIIDKLKQEGVLAIG